MVRQFTMGNGLFAVGIAAILGTTVQAQNTTATPSAADEKFAMAAAQSGMAEMQWGALAAQQGSSAKVKEFGQKMVDEHGKANEDLKTVAVNKGIALPEEPNARQKATLERLTKLHGAAFDSAYIKETKAYHKTCVADFKKEATTGRDVEIKGFAKRTLPVVESHYEILMKM